MFTDQIANNIQPPTFAARPGTTQAATTQSGPGSYYGQTQRDPSLNPYGAYPAPTQGGYSNDPYTAQGGGGTGGYGGPGGHSNYPYTAQGGGGTRGYGGYGGPGGYQPPASAFGQQPTPTGGGVSQGKLLLPEHHKVILLSRGRRSAKCS